MKYMLENNRLHIKNINYNKNDIVIRKKELKDYPLHWHDCFEIEIILSGKGTQTLNGKIYNMRPGDIYILNPTDFHEVKISETTEIINIMFAENFIDEDFLYTFMKSNENFYFNLNEDEFKNVVSMFSLAIDEFKREEKGYEAFIKNIIECVFVILSRKTNIVKSESKNISESAIHKALLYIHRHFRENPSMEEVAKAAGFNASYFCTLFHKITGLTFKDYLNGLKLEHARRLVLSSRLSVTEICFSSGFNSLSHFLREYKNKYSETVSQTRKKRASV